MSTFKKGDKVAQIVPIIRGEITGFRIDENTGDRLVGVSWQTDDGEQSRYFNESDIELDAEANAAASPAPAADTMPPEQIATSAE